MENNDLPAPNPPAVTNTEAYLAMLNGVEDLPMPNPPATNNVEYYLWKLVTEGGVGGATKGYYYNGAFYKDQAHTELITPKEGALYYDTASSSLYIYDGENYVAVGVSGIGRFLSGWNATTGLPVTNPGELPYTYTTGDYYIVSTTGATNYKPTGSTYDGTASSTVETGNVQVNDFYFYDGTQWLLLKNNTPTTTETLYFTLADDSVVSKTFYVKTS